ncbi:hypothetical protein FHG87_016236 [Trinorchestia longiramus]|nr:hypothetical protein FHG87_016236 [Trinorchestia longiramus]
MKVLSIATFLAVIGSSLAVQCYVCNSKVDSSCNDPFANSSPALIEAFLKSCPEKEGDEEPFCRKTKMWCKS